MPFQSKAQVRACFAKSKSGQSKDWDCHEWAAHTPNMRKLPEKAAQVPSGGQPQPQQTQPSWLEELSARFQPSDWLTTALANPAGFGAGAGLTLGLGAGAGAGLARGNVLEGLARGAIRGPLTGLGVGAGSVLGQHIGRSLSGNDLGALLGTIAGSGVGGLAGWAGSGALLGKPSGGRKPDPHADIEAALTEH